MKTHDTISVQTACPRCGTRQPKVADECWLCGTSRGADGMLGTAAASRSASFSLKTLFAISTLVACSSGILAASHGWAVLASPLVFLVGVRTLVVLKRRRDKGIATSQMRKISLFTRSLIRTAILATLYVFAGLMFVTSVALVYIFCVAENINFIVQHVAYTSLLACIWFFAAIFSGIEKRFHYDTSRH